MPVITNSPPSVEIVYEIARRENVSPADLQPPLWSAVDSDALDRLFSDGTSPCSVEFTYREYAVRVERSDDGRVEISTTAGPTG